MNVWPQPLARPIGSFPSRPFGPTATLAADVRTVVGFRHRFTIAGTALAVAAATLRIRNTDPSDCYLTLAGIPSVDLSALVGAEITWTVTETLSDGTTRDADVFMFYLDRTNVAETVSDYVVEITGERQLTYGNPQTVALEQVLMQSSTNSDQRWRLPMRRDLKPGDTVTFETASLLIDQINYFIGPTSSYIEVSDG